MIKYLIYDTLPLLDREIFETEFEKMSSYRKEKIQRYHSANDQQLSLGAGIVLNYLLKEYGLEEQNINVETGKYGKPYFPDYPQLFFNLSHSGHYVLGAISTKKIGCDIEQVVKDLTIVQSALHVDEVSYIRQKHISKQCEIFSEIWTKKESYVKAIGIGFYLRPDSFCILSEENMKRYNTEEQYKIKSIIAPSGYKAAICTLL
jgi:4'-phosphopantetheinyl transferase